MRNISVALRHRLARGGVANVPVHPVQVVPGWRVFPANLGFTTWPGTTGHRENLKQLFDFELKSSPVQLAQVWIVRHIGLKTSRDTY